MLSPCESVLKPPTALLAAMRQYQMGADVKADIARTSQAVDNAEEELKEWKKANREDEQHVKQVRLKISGARWHH